MLGQALARRAGMDYEALVHSRIAGPLGMTSTGITLTPEMKARLAVGHNAQVESGSQLGHARAGGRGRAAVERQRHADLSGGQPGLREVAAGSGDGLDAGGAPADGRSRPGRDRPRAGWSPSLQSDERSSWHNGGTGGYRSFVGFEAKTGVGVVVLSNTFTAAGIDDIGMHLLDSHAPCCRAERPQRDHRRSEDFRRLRGSIPTGAEFHSDGYARGRSSSLPEATGQSKVQIFREGEQQFFYKVVDAQITFETDSSGLASGLILHQNGADMPAKRIQ